MLGKRCRTIQRTASISQNMGPHYLHHNYNNYNNYHDFAANAKQYAEKSSLPSHSINPQVPAIVPQIIGFNPMIKSAGAGASRDQSQAAPNQSPKSMSARPHPHDMYDDDPACASAQLHQKVGSGGAPTSKRSQITPRSALQTLLAAARQITFPSSTDQSPTLINSYTSKNEGSMSSLKAGASPTTSSISAKQGLWQGFSALSEVKSKEVNNKQAGIVISEVTKPAPEAYYHTVNVNEAECDVVFDVEETSYFATDSEIGSESKQSWHALYLATSPLTADFTPNLAASMSFLESCYLCKRPLGQGRDIFMYRGESAFCSVECRDKQMRMEERKEKLRQMQANMNSRVQKQDSYTNTNITSSSNVPHQQHHKHHHHHHPQYGGQPGNNKQRRTSLLMPVA